MCQKYTSPASVLELGYKYRGRIRRDDKYRKIVQIEKG
jgi:hypothetical protein